MTLREFLVILHIIATVLGVGGSTFSSIIFMRALKDGKIDPFEADALHETHFVLRIGMVLMLLSGFGLLLSARFNGHADALYDPRIWAKLILSVILVLNAIAIQTRKISAWWGGAISIVSWYAALILGVWRHLDASWWAIALVYVGAVVAAYFTQEMIRRAMGVKK